MTGSDEGGYRPHPGDPWYPRSSDDEQSGDELEPAPTDPESPEQEPTAPQRRIGDQREATPDDLSESGFDPNTAAFEDVKDPTAGIAPDAEVDPFDAVLAQEGKVSRFRAGSTDESPPPAWTIDKPPDPFQTFPVEQPSWIGQTTGGAPGIEAVGFEPEQIEDLVGDEVALAVPNADAVESATPEVLEQVTADDGVVGQYGVAGPEAFDALATDDAATGEIDEWDSYMSQPPPAVATEGSPAIPSAPVRQPEAFEDQFEPEPKRRGLFRRGKRPLEEEVIDDGFVGDAIEPGFVSETPDPDVGDSTFGRPAEPPAGGEAFDEWYEAEPIAKRGLFRRRKSAEPDIIQDGLLEVGGGGIDDRTVQPTAFEDEMLGVPSVEPFGVDDVVSMSPESILDALGVEPMQDASDEAPFLSVEDFGFEPPDQVEGGDVAAALAEALEPLGVDDDSGPIDIEPPFEPIPADPVTGVIVEVGEQGDLFAEPDEPRPADQIEPIPEPSAAVAEPEGLDQFDSDDGDDADSEAVADWQDDPGRLPAAWIADIDEDEVVPPPVAETPDTEVDEVPQGTWEGQAQWQAEPVDLFDIEEPEPAEVVEAPQDIVAIPEGYEPWQEAVTDAVSETDIDDGTYEYEQPLLQDQASASDGLPPGFEPFPGGGGIEQFELPEETMLSHLETNEFDEGWVTDDVNVAEMPTEAMDIPYPGDAEFDEEIYASGGTIEHRDLAAAIAEAGDERTQWHAISAAMPGMETGVLGFDDVADLGSGGEYVAPIKSNLGARVATGVALVVLLFGSLLWASEAFAVFVGLLVMLGLAEFYGALRRVGYLPLGLFGIVGGIGILAATWFHGPLAIPAGVLLTSMVTFFFYAFSPTRRDALSNGGLTTLGVSWVVATAAFAIPIGRAEEHVVLVFAVVAVTAATDIGAYWFGRTWGKRPLASALSPNKTTEGLAGAVIFAFAVAGAIGFFELGPFDLKSGLALGAVAAFLAPIGDLAESMIKRSLGVKDMGSTLPGHGGVLDRIDAFLFVIPAAWVLYEAIGFLG